VLPVPTASSIGRRAAIDRSWRPTLAGGIVEAQHRAHDPPVAIHVAGRQRRRHMTTDRLTRRASEHLRHLCVDIGARPAGSRANQAATTYVAGVLADLGFDVATPRFEVVDWVGGAVLLEAGGEAFAAEAGPYALGCRVAAPLAVASTVEAIERVDVAGCVLLLHGDVAREQLMPKGFTYYDSERHRRIVCALEAARPVAVVAATGRDPGSAGGLSPFPLIEDGDVDVPSVYLTEAEGARLARLAGQRVRLESDGRRIASWGCNVVATRAAGRPRRAVACAHVDTKLGTPGALDDAAGVVTLLLLAELLGADGDGSALTVELVAMNGEDHFANPGERVYFAAQEGRRADVVLAINLDGVGYRVGHDAASTYGCEGELAALVAEALAAEPGLVAGPPWYQGDHAVFVMHGVPALAVTSERIEELVATVVHTPADTVELVDPVKLVRLAFALRGLIERLSAAA
jgi:aminopeptidase YwaD